jgi:hypothetical protein
MKSYLFEANSTRCLCGVIEMGMIPSITTKESISPTSHVVNFVRSVMGVILLYKVIPGEF